MESLKGSFLVASPHLPDPNFYRTVVLMIQHNDQGAWGVVLNRPTQSSIREVWGMLSEEPCDCEKMILLGGPVAGSLMAVHADPSCSEGQVLPGVHLATQTSNLNRLVRQQQWPFELFYGYAGWAPGQLEGEMRQGGWLTAPASFEDVFGPQEDLWRKMARSIGLRILEGAIPHRRIPDDPSVN